MTSPDIKAIIELTDRHNQQITQRISDLTQSTDHRFEQIASSIDKMSDAVVAVSNSTIRFEEKANGITVELEHLNKTQRDQGQDIRDLEKTVTKNNVAVKISAIIGSAFIVGLVGVAVTSLYGG